MTDSYVPGDRARTAEGQALFASEDAAGRSTSEVAGDEAADLGEHAKDAGMHVADVAKGQASEVAGEVKYQAKDLMDQARSELTEQARTQQERAAKGLHSMSQQFIAMGENSGQSGMATDLVRRAGMRAGALADWLDVRDPGSLLEEVKDFARRRTGIFVAVAAVAGVAAGRLARAAMSGGSQGGEQLHASQGFRESPGFREPPAYREEPVYRGETTYGEGRFPGGGEPGL